MPALSRQGDTIMSPDGSGRDCDYPVETFVDQCNSNNVFANGKLVVVQGNKIAAHNKSGCSVDESTLTEVSSKVFIGGKGVGRIGDKYGDNVITQGSSDVFAN